MNMNHDTLLTVNVQSLPPTRGDGTAPTSRTYTSRGGRVARSAPRGGSKVQRMIRASGQAMYSVRPRGTCRASVRQRRNGRALRRMRRGAARVAAANANAAEAPVAASTSPGKRESPWSRTLLFVILSVGFTRPAQHLRQVQTLQGDF